MTLTPRVTTVLAAVAAMGLMAPAALALPGETQAAVTARFANQTKWTPLAENEDAEWGGGDVFTEATFKPLATRLEIWFEDGRVVQESLIRKLTMGDFAYTRTFQPGLNFLKSFYDAEVAADFNQSKVLFAFREAKTGKSGAVYIGDKFAYHVVNRKDLATFDAYPTSAVAELLDDVKTEYRLHEVKDRTQF